MESKATINYKEGIIEIFGSEDFIMKYLDKYHEKTANDLILSETQNSGSLPPATQDRDIFKTAIPIAHRLSKGNSYVYYNTPSGKEQNPYLIEPQKSKAMIESQDMINYKPGRKSKKQATKKAKSGKASRSKSVTFNTFSTDNKPSLAEFLTQNDAFKNSTKLVVTIGYYITKIKGFTDFSMQQIDYAFEALSIPDKPAHVYQLLFNAKKQKHILESLGNGRWALNDKGEEYVTGNSFVDTNEVQDPVTLVWEIGQPLSMYIPHENNFDDN